VSKPCKRAQVVPQSLVGKPIRKLTAGSDILTPNLIVHGFPTMSKRTFTGITGQKLGSRPNDHAGLAEDDSAEKHGSFRCGVGRPRRIRDGRIGALNKKIYQSTITQFSGQRIGFPTCAGPPCGLVSLPDVRRDFASLNLVLGSWLLALGTSNMPP